MNAFREVLKSALGSGALPSGASLDSITWEASLLNLEEPFSYNFDYKRVRQDGILYPKSMNSEACEPNERGLRTCCCGRGASTIPPSAGV